MSNESSSEPLPLDVLNPNRQATDVIRGYEYQIWQSVLRWVTLKPGETLFLERAEDFDVTERGVAVTTQVKDTARSGSITLNSPSVVEAISNFWMYQRANSNRIIRFRLLTTSTRGLERSNPFNGVKGLDYWDGCKGNHTDLAPLRDLLARKTDLPEELHQFLSESSDDDLRNYLIRRIEWSSDQGDHEAIKEIIKKRVVEHGITIYSRPSESEKVVDALFTHVLAVIRQDGDRRLEPADFARVFEEQVTSRFTPEEIEDLRVRIGAASSFSQRQFLNDQVTSSFAERIEDLYDIRLLETLVERGQLASESEAKLKQKGFLVLKGSTGVGKSILAVIVARRQSGMWKRLDYRNLQPEQIKEHLVTATLYDVAEGSEHNYIIDDLNFSDRPSIYEKSLGSFVQAVISRGGRIVLTTQGEMPTRLSLAFDVSEQSIVDVPHLTDDEIQEMATKHGCPAGRLVKTWSGIILATTGGHPQLVHARIKRIAAEQWPQPQLDDLLRDAGADQVRDEVRRYLSEYIPSEATRTLAYRLSVYVNTFKRSHALHLAGHPEPIANPGESFDFLVGPWVESYGRGYYKLSPLLKNSAQEIFDRQTVINLHKTATYSFFVDRTLTQTEINGILIHGLAGQIAEPLQRIAEATENVSERDWALIAQEIEWFAHLAIENNSRLFEANPLTSLTLRRFQFRIATGLDKPELATKVVISWDSELARFDEFNDMPDFIIPRLALQQMFNVTFLRLEVPIPITTMVRNIVTAITIGKQWEAVAERDEAVQRALEMKRKLYDKLPKDQMQVLHEELGSDLDKIVDISDDVYFCAVRCQSAKDVSDFIDELTALTSDSADEIWSYLGSNEFTAIMLVNGAWLSEVKASAPDWDTVLSVLDKVAIAGLAKHADHLVAAAYRSKAIVLKEYAIDKGDASDAIDEGIQKLGYEHPALQDYRAKIYMMDGRYEEAIEIWRAIPPEDESRQTTWRIFSHRDAIMCAGFVGNWSSAAEFAIEGERAARRLCHMGEVVASGYRAERSWALWKSGRYETALSELAQVINTLKTLPDPNADIMSYGLHIRILMAVNWLVGNRSANVVEPQLGIFSDPNPEITRERDLVRQAFYALIEAELEMVKLKTALRSGSIDSLISQYARFSELSKELSGSQKVFTLPKAFDGRMILNLIFAALVNWIGRGSGDELPIEKWIEDARTNSLLDDEVVRYFNFLQELVKTQGHSLRAALNDLRRSGDERLAASLFLSISDELSPEDRFVANFFLITSGNAYAMWREETEEIVAEMIGRTWMTVVQQQQSSLLAPSTNVPQIKSAIEDLSSVGIVKASRILLAALRAVNVRLPDHALERLSGLASGSTPHSNH